MAKPISLSPDAIKHYEEIVVNDEVEYDLLHNAPTIAWMVKPAATAFWYNRAFYDFSGKTPEFMKNWAWQDFLPVEEIPETAASFYNALDLGISWKRTYHFKVPDNSYRLLLVQAVPIRNGKGDVKYWLGDATDITDVREGRKRRIVKKLP